MATDITLMLLEATKELEELQPMDPKNMPDLSGIIEKLESVTLVLKATQKMWA